MNNFTTILEIENSHEWKVLMTNDPNVMGTRLIDGLIRLISRKVGVDTEFVKSHYQKERRERILP